MIRFAILSFGEGGVVLQASTTLAENAEQALQVANVVKRQGTKRQVLISNEREIAQLDLFALEEAHGFPTARCLAKPL